MLPEKKRRFFIALAILIGLILFAVINGTKLKIESKKAGFKTIQEYLDDKNKKQEEEKEELKQTTILFITDQSIHEDSYLIEELKNAGYNVIVEENELLSYTSETHLYADNKDCSYVICNGGLLTEYMTQTDIGHMEDDENFTLYSSIKKISQYFKNQKVIVITSSKFVAEEKSIEDELDLATPYSLYQKALNTFCIMYNLDYIDLYNECEPTQIDIIEETSLEFPYSQKIQEYMLENILKYINEE